MLKDNKGITLIALVITVIILMIVASITVSSGLNTAKESKYYNVIAEMKTVQAKVNEIYEEFSNGDENVKAEILAYGEEIVSHEKSTQAQKAYNAVKATDSEEAGLLEDYRYYSIDYIKNTLDVHGIENDFIVNIKLRTVILVDGITKDGTIYYALCQIPNEQYNVQYENI